MSESPSRFTWVVKLARAWALIALASTALAIVLTAAQIATKIVAGEELRTMLWWILALVAETTAAISVVLIHGLAETAVSNESGVQQMVDGVKRLEALAEALREDSRRLVDLGQMSEAAKSLLFREREIEAMNDLLHEHLLHQEYAKAEALADDVARRFGYAEQVAGMRAEIARSRESTAEQKIDAAVERINRQIDSRSWTAALRNAERLLKLMPDSPRVAALPQLIHDARAEHKRDLLASYGEAVKNGDIDLSIELLRELDKYLTPQEAAALEDSARGVFRAKLHNLGVQFAIRVTEEQWAEAVAIGEEIVSEYPNSRMAEEVRMKMETLRMLAAPPV